MPAFYLSQREARQNLTPQRVRIGHTVRIKIHQPLTEFGIVTLSEIRTIWTINQQAKYLKSPASTLAVVGKSAQSDLM